VAQFSVGGNMHYGLVIQNLLREQRETTESLDDFDPDLPF
jgi:hypothetical protein